MVAILFPCVLVAANLPCHTGSPGSSGVLNSFVLLIHKGASWCSYAESCSDGVKSDFRLFMWLPDKYSARSSAFRRTSSWSLQFESLCCLRIPVYVWQHLPAVIHRSLYQDRIKDSYQLTADGYHRLFLFQGIYSSCGIILMQWPEFRIGRDQWNTCIEQEASQPASSSFADRGLSLVFPWAILPEG